MNTSELSDAHLNAIRAFVNGKLYLEIKDAFISHTPEGSPDGQRTGEDSKNLGKLLGTRYVFNQLEKLARTSNEKTRKREGNTSGVDPDLEES